MADIKLGLNTEAFRHADKPLEYALAAIRKQGYRYCELNMLNGRDLLCEAARTPPAGRARGAAPDVDPGNRWSVFADLPAAARGAACQAALARLEAMRPDQAA